MSLVSPGVQVTIIDQSTTPSSVTNTVPLILLATAQDKIIPSGTTVAPATTAAAANQLFSVTSQQSLLNLFGNPFFYTTTNGTPINGYELNEYGLLAAYSALGQTNQAWVLRAGIDLAQLIGQVGRPKFAPADGTYWLDTTNSSWGLFQFSLATGIFTAQSPIVIVEPSQVDTNGVPLTSIGDVGDYAVVQVPGFLYDTNYNNSTYFFKSAGGGNVGYPGSLVQPNTWVAVGSEAWKASWPTLQGDTFNSPTAQFTFTIATVQTPANGVTITVAVGASAQDVVASINSASIPYISAEVVDSRIVIYSAQPDVQGDYITIASASITALAGIGITALSTGTTYYQPATLWAKNANQPRWRSTDPTPHPTGSVFIKVDQANRGANLIVSQYSNTTASWTPEPAPWYTSDAQANELLGKTSGDSIPVGKLYTQYGANDTAIQIWRRAVTGELVVTGTENSPTFVGGEQVLISYSTSGSDLYSEWKTLTIPTTGSGNIDSFLTAFSAATSGAPYVTANANPIGQVVLTHTQGGSIVLNDNNSIGVQAINLSSAVSGGNYLPVATGSVVTVTIGAPNLTKLTATVGQVTTTNSIITSIPVTFGGTGYETPPNVTISGPTATSGLQATATASIADGAVVAINITNGGLGYTTTPTVTIAAPTPYTQATATATTATTGVLGGVVLSAPGAGYNPDTTTYPLVVEITNQPGDRGSGAVAKAVLSTDSVLYVTLKNGGSGYTGNPTFTVTQPGIPVPVTTPATGSFNLFQTVTGVTVTNAGSGYTVAPTVTFTSSFLGATTPWTAEAQATLDSIYSVVSSDNVTYYFKVVVAGTFGQTAPTNTLGDQVNGDATLVSVGQDASVNSVLSVGIVSKLGLKATTLGGTSNNAKASPGVTRSYANVSPDTQQGQSGGGATFNVITSVDSYILQLTAGGSGYSIGQVLDFNTRFPGLTIKVTGVINSGTITSFFIEAGAPTLTPSNELSNWQAFVYTPNEGAPAVDPADGTLWFFSVVDQVDIMIRDNESATGWAGYKTVKSDTRGFDLTQTDPNGPIVQANAPTTQSDGTPLVSGDLWIDTSDLENYPVINRWQPVNGVSQWVLINNADGESEDGVIFEDARWAPNGTTNPINDPIPSITSLLESNYLDLDAPDPALYPEGILLFNTRRSGYNVKSYTTNYFTLANFPDEILPLVTSTWITASGNQSNGSPYMGRKAQRAVVVKSLNEAINTNTDILEEDRFFNLIVCPNYPELQPSMITLNNNRSNTAYIIGDTPLRLPADSTTIIDWATNKAGASATGEQGLVTRNNYMGLYYPAGQTTDLTGNQVVVPPSHMILYTMLYNDTVAYPWFAPAGINRGIIQNASSVGYLDATTGEFIVIRTGQGLRDTLYTNQINPIAFFTGIGLLNYGNKNSANTQTALSRTNVARLVSFIRTQLQIIAKPFIFEPNDTATRNGLRSVVQTLLANILTQRGLYDYLVVCDTSNNTPARISANQLWCDVAIEPVIAVEFIYIPVYIENTGAISQFGSSIFNASNAG